MADDQADTPSVPAEPLQQELPAALPENEPVRFMDFAIRVTHAKGRIEARCLPTLHDFLVDELVRGGFHAMRALANAIAETLEQERGT